MLGKNRSKRRVVRHSGARPVLHRRPADDGRPAAGRQELGAAVPNDDPSKGPTGELRPYTELELQGRAIYVREACWYCHTQQTRTLLADTNAPAGRGVDSPISTPDEFVYDSPHLFGTKRTGPDLSRVGGKLRHAVASHAFPQSRDLVPGSIMPPFPWIVDDPEEFEAIVAYLQNLGRAKNWRPDEDYEE